MPSLRNSQRGAATLIVAMVLLFGTSMILFSLNKSLIFDQKGSANQVRATVALEAAEAGMEWATAMLNRPHDIQANCTVNNNNIVNSSFRRKYVQVNYANATNIANRTNLDISVAPDVRPGCYLSGGALTCSCPASGDAVLTPPSALPGFTVSFAKKDQHSVEVTSTGCNAISGPCTNTTASTADATATVKAILKLRPLLRAVPPAALSCGRNCELSGGFTVTNRDSRTNGITINAGGNVAGTAGAVTTIPGMPSDNSVISNDSSLGALVNGDETCSNDAVFNAYFGTTLDRYINDASTKSITCTSASECGTALQQAYANGWRSYYFPSGLDLNNTSSITTLGSTADPVTLVSKHAIKLNGTTAVYGLVFSNEADYGDIGTGSSTIHGALVSCKDFKSNGKGSINYDADALKQLKSGSALMVRIPGSWRDF